MNTAMDEDRAFEEQLLQTVHASLKRRDRLRARAIELDRELAGLYQEAHYAQQEAERLHEECRIKKKESEELEKDYSAAHMLHIKLEFEAQCLALRRNDPNTHLSWKDKEVSRLPNYSMIRGYAQPLGDALRGNTNVTNLFLDLRNLLDSDNPNNPPSDVARYIKPLVNFVSTSQVLERVENIYGHRDKLFQDHLCGAFLEAMGVSSSIEELAHNGRLPPESFRTMMTSTVSLKRLELGNLESCGVYTDSELADLGVAFRDNHSLERLQLGMLCGLAPTAQILSALPGHRTLQELVLCGYGNSETMEHWNLMCHCLCSLEALRHLALANFQFSGEMMQAFLNCLLLQGTVDDLLAPITKLSLEGCAFNTESTALFVEFMRTKIKGDNSSARLCCLRELCFVEHTGRDTTLWLTGPLLVSLLLPTDPSEAQGNECQTIVSQLSSLSLNVTNFEGFLEELAENVREIQLDTLRLVELDVTHCHALKTCVLKMPHLRNLHLAKVWYPSESSCIILNMLQQSETLQTFVVEEHYSDNETGLLFDDAGARLAEAYCSRNRYLATLLEREAEWGRPIPSDRAVQALYPTLLQATKQITKCRLVSLSSSLEKLGDFIGPWSIAV
jgi:hypothetical protein